MKRTIVKLLFCACLVVVLVFGFFSVSLAVPGYVSVTSVNFVPVTAGYAQPAPLPITILNDKDVDIDITGITVLSNSIPAYTIISGNTTIPAHTSDSSWAIQPLAGLPPARYWHTIKVSYDDHSGVPSGGTTAPVAFNVMYAVVKPVPDYSGSPDGWSMTIDGPADELMEFGIDSWLFIKGTDFTVASVNGQAVVTVNAATMARFSSGSHYAAGNFTGVNSETSTFNITANNTPADTGNAGGTTPTGDTGGPAPTAFVADVSNSSSSDSTTAHSPKTNASDGYIWYWMAAAACAACSVFALRKSISGPTQGK